jgi:hypothetical protein
LSNCLSHAGGRSEVNSVSTLREQQSRTPGAGFWDRYRWLIVAILAVAIAVALVIVVAYSGGGSGGGGGGGY